MEEGQVSKVSETPAPQNPVTDVPSGEMFPKGKADTPVDPPSEEPKAEEPPKPDPIPRGVQRRLDKLTRQKYESEARVKMLEERIAAFESGRTIPVEKDSGAPTIDKFDNFDEYVAAKAEYVASKKIEAALAEREKLTATEREKAEQASLRQSWEKKVEAATAEMPDFEEVISESDTPMTPPMQQAIMASDIGPKLAYYLATHPDEAEQIARMDATRTILTLGKIEERLVKPVTKPTSAPPPVKPAGASATVKKDPGKMTDAEYEKWRKSAAA